MNECSTGEQIAAFVFGFLFVFLIHAVPMAYLFKSWGHRYALGLLPAAFCALGAATYFGFEASCGLIQSKGIAMAIAAAFYIICYLLIVFFKPDLKLPVGGWGDAIIPVILSVPMFGAVAAAIWLLLSIGNGRLLFDTGKEVALKDRAIETSLHAAMTLLLAAYIVYHETH